MKTERSAATTSRKWVSAFVFVLALSTAGCGRHPKATSRESMDLIKQVYTACNTKNVARLEACKSRLAELESLNKISSEEAASFNRLIELATKGEWESAQRSALQFAQDQVR